MWIPVHDLADWLRNTLLPYGPLGLVVIAFFDSSFLSLPEINDILVMSLSIADHQAMPIYAMSATIGSVLGSLTLHTIGKQTGYRALARKLGPGRARRLRSAFRRFDMLVVVVPSLLPPPCPFKIFVLGSGVFGMPYGRFAVAVTLGRASRYFIEGWLAVAYGERALSLLKDHPVEAAGLALALALTAGLAWRIGRRLVTRVS